MVDRELLKSLKSFASKINAASWDLLNQLKDMEPQPETPPEQAQPEPEPAVQETKPEPATPPEERPTPDFAELKQLLLDKKWPVAVPEGLICDEQSDDDKMERAEGILDLIVEENLDNKKFLDFGCGEGHLVKKAWERKPRMAFGYDIAAIGPLEWEKREDNYLLTTNWDRIKRNAPFEVIVLYDVLDHIVDEDPVEVLKRIKEVKTDTGKVYVRCHPWVSRHGGHLYKKINKAFVHLVFSEEELLELGYGKPEPTLKLMHPATSYREMFEKAGFKRISEEIIEEKPEHFFVGNQGVRGRIQDFWKDSYQEGLRSGKVFPGFQTGQSFIDYVLT